MTLLDIIQKNKIELSELDQDILKYILNHLDIVKDMGIVELGDEVHVSKSTILRLTKKLGFSGFSEFKYYLRHDMNLKPIKQGNILEMQTQDIARTLDHLMQMDCSDILSQLHEASIIYCYGTGFSQRKMIEGFTSQMLHIGKRIIIIPSKTELDMSMPMITHDDFVIFISLSGETEEVKVNIDELKIRGIKQLAITAEGDNYFRRQADYALTYATGAIYIPKSHYRIARSFVGLSVVLDYLFRKYLQYIMTLESELS